MFGSLGNWIQSNIPVQIPPLFKQTNDEDGKKEESEKQQQQQQSQEQQVKVENAAVASVKQDIATTEQSTTSNGSTSSQATVIPPPTTAGDAADAVTPKPTNDEDNNDEVVDDLKLLHIDKQKAIDTAKEIGNFLWSFGKTAGKQIQEKATHLKDVIEKNTIIGEFSKENEKFVNEKKTQQRREEAAVPPWVGYLEEEKMKQQILSLSNDSRNFLRSPPQGVEFHFDFNLAYPIALATLEEDPNLKEMRFNLVPKQINEEGFWRNYFYRVSLIKQSTQLNELANEHGIYSGDNKETKETETDQKNTNKKADNNLDVSNVDTTAPTNEFVSDLYETTINEEEIKRDMKQLKLDNTKINDDLDDHEWDKEIEQVDDIDNITAEELEKEISEMIQTDMNTK